MQKKQNSQIVFYADHFMFFLDDFDIINNVPFIYSWYNKRHRIVIKHILTQRQLCSTQKKQEVELWEDWKEK